MPLTVHNATKAQLVCMVKDRDLVIHRQQEEIEDLRKQIKQCLAFCADLMVKTG